jgi:hypothetical protein
MLKLNTQVLSVCEGLYRSVDQLLPTLHRRDSKRKTYMTVPEMDSSFFSLLTNKTSDTRVQREHLDDDHPGVAAVWGLFEGQYIIVWLWSYEMNLELESIHEFYDFVVSKRPEDWTKEAFWNLVAGIHLKRKGFKGDKRPTPVKIPLKVGDLLLMDMKVIHAGMHFTKRRNLRAHLYWAQVAGRHGVRAQEHTFFLWESHHMFYPAWHFISEDRMKFEKH